MTDATSADWYSNDNATFGDRLALAREAAGMTQTQLAGRLGVRPTVLEAWENDRKEPRANRLQMLTGLLGISLRWLLTGVGDGPEPESAMSPEVTDLLAEIRGLRATISQAGVDLGQLEKRLRLALKDDE